MRKLLVTLVAAVTAAAGCTVVGEQPPPAEDGASVKLRVIEAQGTALALVPVHIKGKGPYQFLLDTGASISTIDEQLAKDLGLEFTGQTADVLGIGGRANVELIRVERWKMGTVALDPGRMAALDLRQDQRGVSGLLGSDVLRDFGQVTVDYRRERLIVPADLASPN
ncbi:retropepsin-like aspartic protease [Nonomuraea sp. SYSU D8015]|uniref:retropepsin-like aspartic protease n=1 Tax=Nonomuraea sp. SYSU D8015 TaxID=2593644 RepID=UPI0016617962|nr:retropepsin-like aspartic protease [Nonomuraea sp. SYSU D8015]